MNPQIVIIGGGVGGIVVANRLARARRDLEVVVLDSHGDHVYQPGLVRVPLERRPGRALVRGLRRLLDPRVRLLVARAQGIDEERNRVLLEGGETVSYDFLVLATGSRVFLETTPGFRDAALHFHCPRRATALRERLAAFSGGDIVVGAMSPPHKCPLAPIEMALLLDENLRQDGRRKRVRLRFLFPGGVDGFHPNACSLFCRLLEERDIEMCAPFDVRTIDASRQEVSDASGGRLPYDLLILAPTIQTAPFLRESSVVDASGFVPVDPETLKLRDGIYALGDNAALPAPKLGSAAALQARAVAGNILRELDDRPPDHRYDGRSLFLAETGRRQAVLVETRYGEAAQARGPGPIMGLKKRLLRRLYFSRLARL